eukprot:TRINITY_DN16808_c0_g1_i1.p1 TRINITY_DN16808_c0_g1~~TRINITY_DN16808_c0_g1_i1.p1  ORF type:complete len:260 (-),score=35.35 TRINITY_DN16808_c0_g1_i1:159-938(-)
MAYNSVSTPRAPMSMMRRRLSNWIELWEGPENAVLTTTANPLLERHFDRLFSSTSKISNCSILLPLCGRSFDLAWLSEQGLQVVGVECSRRAIALFAAERGFELVAGDGGGEESVMRPWYVGPCTIFEGDWFDATPELLGGRFELAFDHLALVAVEPSRRKEYAQKMLRVLHSKKAARILLIVPEFDEALLDPAVTALGPHSLSVPEVQELFPDFSLEVLSEEDAIETEAFSRLRAAGLESAIHRAILLERLPLLFTPR